MRLNKGDCFLLPGGRPFRLASDLALPPVEAATIYSNTPVGGVTTCTGGGDCLIVGSFFTLTGQHTAILARHAAADRSYPK
ncbi:MAG: cupin domain-containing protein [Rhodospirillales bacterium]